MLNFLKNKKGQGMAEYIIIVMLVAILVLIGVKFFGNSIFQQFNNATSGIEQLDN
ncbi:MAG: hypothetical protein IT292_04470 [Deltaproteobacteria bacterium]|nr:hypothetical protein [Deltaproteobacteria bacterium]